MSVGREGRLRRIAQVDEAHSLGNVYAWEGNILGGGDLTQYYVPGVTPVERPTVP